jgi:hypothetical protein
MVEMTAFEARGLLTRELGHVAIIHNYHVSARTHLVLSSVNYKDLAMRKASEGLATAIRLDAPRVG